MSNMWRGAIKKKIPLFNFDSFFPYKIVDRFVHRRLHVSCDMSGGGWTLIQRRGQFGNPKDYFFRGWNDYFHGFGHLDREFWMGLDNIQAMADADGGDTELLVELWPGQNDTSDPAFARYSDFSLSDDGKFRLELGKYSGTAGDALAHSRHREFSTRDRDSDVAEDANCAEHLTGAWWYGSCTDSNLNGRNYNAADAPEGKGVVWGGGDGPFNYTHSMSRAEMKIRPRLLDLEGGGV